MRSLLGITEMFNGKSVDMLAIRRERGMSYPILICVNLDCDNMELLLSIETLGSTYASS